MTKEKEKRDREKKEKAKRKREKRGKEKNRTSKDKNSAGNHPDLPPEQTENRENPLPPLERRP
jgi:hypothetical protein